MRITQLEYAHNFSQIYDKVYRLKFRINRRGYIREGYYADLVIVDPAQSWVVSPENILYKCGWSPFNGTEFSHQVTQTFVNGDLVYADGNVVSGIQGKRLKFNR